MKTRANFLEEAELGVGMKFSWGCLLLVVEDEEKEELTISTRQKTLL